MSEKAWPVIEHAADAAYARPEFDWTTVFFDDPELIGKLLKVYEEASGEAVRLARLAVRGGKPETRERALWAEAVAETLAAVLGAIPHTSEVTGEDGEVFTEEDDGGWIVLPRLPSAT